MEQKIEEVKKEDQQQANEYFQFIKESVEDRSYFKDAFDWYIFRYVTPICDRTLLIFGAMVAGLVLYYLVQMIDSAFPLVVRDPIFIEAQDQSQYFPNLVALKPKEGKPNYDPGLATVDEAVAKYLLSTYVSDREGFDFRKAEISEVNTKFNRIKNVSSAEEYRAFQLTMSKDNPDSPINDFGQNVYKTINVESVRFIKKDPKDLAQKAMEYLSNKIPTEAEVRFVATKTTIADDQSVKNEKERYVAKIRFSFAGIDKNDKSGILKFSVNGYKLFKVK